MIVATAILVIGAAAWLHSRSSGQASAALAPLREQYDALRAQADENRHQIEATTQILRDAIGKHEGELFKTDQEIRKLNGQRIDALADAIAKKVVPAIPGPKTPEELARAEDEQVDRISTRTAEKIRPALAALEHDRTAEEGLTKTVAQDNQRIAQLDASLRGTQAAAQDALKLTHEVSALYLDSFKDQGVLVRILALPADLIRDGATGNLVSSRDRAKEQRKLDERMGEIEKRLSQIRSQGFADPLASEN
jgi:type II secretory pathway pseudopilin PulG